MMISRAVTRLGSRAQRGQMMVIFALTITVFIGAMMLGIDLSRLRAEAENAQRAVNAAALAGVVFLPNYSSSAYSRAIAVAKQNGFVSTSTNGIVIDPESVDSNQLKVTITEPVSLFFGGIFGLGSKTISRSATAEYDEPLEMGAPDYVLGYAPFPTNLVSGGSGYQGFYLIARGPYGQQENGDAYSQYFESYKNKGLSPTGSNVPVTDPCSPYNNCSGLVTNPDRDPSRGGISFTGYDFVVDNPFTHTLVIKIFDPYDEGPLNADSTSNKPSSHLPPAPFNGGLPDQFSCAAGNTNICNTTSYTPGITPTFPVALQFRLTGPYQSTFDTSDKPVAVAPTNTVTTTSETVTCSDDCVMSNYSVGGNNYFVAGNDPWDELCYVNSPITGSCGSSPSPYAYRFLNYAIITHQGLYHIHVNTTANVYGRYNGKYGNGGNAFGLAVCADSSPVLGGDPSNPGGNARTGWAATSDPDPGIPSSAAWNAASCPNPNSFSGAPAACSTPGTAPAGTCVHIYAVNRMAIYANLNSGKGLVPLGYVPPEYDGKTLRVRLYDVGDISKNASVEVLTPAGDTTHYDSSTVSGYPASLPYTFSASPTDIGSEYGISATQTISPASEITVTSPTGAHPFNGSWLTINVPIQLPSGLTYRGMVGTFGGYWKMLYDIGGAATDTTTWEISVTGAPVHLISPAGS